MVSNYGSFRMEEMGREYLFIFRGDCAHDEQRIGLKKEPSKRNIELIVQETYSDEQLRQMGLTYKHKQSSEKWSVWEYNGARAHFENGRYRFTFIPQNQSEGYMKGLGKIIEGSVCLK